MEQTDTRQAISEQIKQLDLRLDALIKRAGKMRRQTDKLAAEHARLKIAQGQVRARVKGMIAHLKSLHP